VLRQSVRYRTGTRGTVTAPSERLRGSRIRCTPPRSPCLAVRVRSFSKSKPRVSAPRAPEVVFPNVARLCKLRPLPTCRR
jgi:hypothetical protein